METQTLIPKFVTVELLCDILICLERIELEKCQLICENWKNIIDKHAHLLPLRYFLELVFHTYLQGDRMVIEATIGYTDQLKIRKENGDIEEIGEDIVVLCYDPCQEWIGRAAGEEYINEGPWYYSKVYLKLLRHVFIEKISFLTYGKFQLEEKFGQFMDKLKELTCYKFMIGSLKKPVYYDFNYFAKDACLLIAKYFQIKYVELPLDNDFLLEEVDRINAKYIDIIQNEMGVGSVLKFLETSRVTTPDRYKVTLHHYRFQVTLSEFFYSWLTLYDQLSPYLPDVIKHLQIRLYRDRDRYPFNEESHGVNKSDLNDFIQFLAHKGYPRETIFEWYTEEQRIVAENAHYTYVIKKKKGYDFNVNIWFVGSWNFTEDVDQNFDLTRARLITFLIKKC